MEKVGKSVNIIVSLLLVAIAAFLVYVSVPFFGNKAMIVRSGSMKPEINTGDLVIVKPDLSITRPLARPEYSLGDVISFQDSANSKIITTHRVMYSGVKEGKAYYQTKGDANGQIDGKEVWEENVLGEVWLTVPGVGKILSFAKTKQGFPLLIVFPAIIVIIIESVNLLKELKKSRPRLSWPSTTPGVERSHNLIIPLLLVALIPPLTFNLSTHAFFSDSGQSSNNIFMANSQFPTKGLQPGDVVINEINWAGSQGDGNDEWVELRNMTGSPINLLGWAVENLGTGTGSGAIVVVATSSSTIPANGFYLIAGKHKDSSHIDVDPDLVVGSVSLSNGGEQLRLKTSTISGILIDTANALTGPWFFGSNAVPKKSMERNNPPGDGTLSGNWHTASSSANMDLSATESATPKAVND